MRYATDGQLIEMVEVNSVWVPDWMAAEMAEGRMSDRAGHELEVQRTHGAIPLPGVKEPKLLTSGGLEETTVGFEGEREGDGRAARN